MTFVTGTASVRRGRPAVKVVTTPSASIAVTHALVSCADNASVVTIPPLQAPPGMRRIFYDLVWIALSAYQPPAP